MPYYERGLGSQTMSSEHPATGPSSVSAAGLRAGEESLVLLLDCVLRDAGLPHDRLTIRRLCHEVRAQRVWTARNFRRSWHRSSSSSA